MVVLELPLNLATIILGCIISVCFSGPWTNKHTYTPIAASTEFFHADAKKNVHPLLVLSHFISLLWRYLCSCMHIMSMLGSIAEAVSSSSWPILFKVLTLNIAICIVLLHLSNFCLSSVADFSNTRARAPTSAGYTPFYPCEGHCGLDMWLK